MDETFGELLGQLLYKELRSGAYMGFFAFAGVIIGLTLIDYYVTGRGVSGWLAWLLCGLPLFFWLRRRATHPRRPALPL